MEVESEYEATSLATLLLIALTVLIGVEGEDFYYHWYLEGSETQEIERRN